MVVRVEKVSEFYDTAVKWWNIHDFTPILEPLLPINVFVLNNKGIDTHCMFAYETDSAFLFIAHPISNRNATKELRKGGFSFLLSEIEKWAKENHYFQIFTTSPQDNVKKVLLNNGFVSGDTMVTHFLKKVV